MAELIVENGPRAGMRFPLTREEPCTIGSGSECKLRIQGLAAQHAVVKAMKDDGFGIKAQDGEVKVQGASVQAVRLSDDEAIDLGPVRLRYQIAPKAVRADGTGQTLGGFRLLEVLGKGGMGIVYRAEQVSLHREVALKVLNKELTQDPVFVARFVAEARAAARLSHPNVVPVIDVGHEGDTYFYSMELLHAGSLEQRLKKEKKLPVQAALAAMRDAARGLAYAESLRIVHRDIKPDNLMLDQHGVVKIADLGLALSDEDDHAKVVGTPHFMSPEQVQKKALDHRSDLYSLGCTFYRLVTGRTPFQGASVKDILRAQLKDDPEPANKIEPEVPAEVAAAITRLMQKDPAARYQSANELLAELDRLLAPPVRRGLLIGGIVTAIAVAGGSLAWALTRKDETKVVTIKETDPKAQEALHKAKELEAEKARLLVETKNLPPAAKAEALEAMANEHPDTESAKVALTDASRLRAEVAAAAKAKSERDERLRAATAKVQQELQKALAAGDVPAADRGLDLPELAADLRSDPMLVAAVQQATTVLHEHTQRQLAAWQQAIATARSSTSLDALRSTVQAIEQAAAPKSGWPQRSLAQPAALPQLLAHARKELAEVEKALASAAEAAAQTEFQQAIAGAGGVLGAFARFDPAAAVRAAEQAVTNTKGKSTAARAEQILAAAHAAESYWKRWQQALAAGQLTLTLGDAEGPAILSDLVTAGDKAGITLSSGPKNKPKQTLLPLAQLRDRRLGEVFGQLPADPGVAERAAFLGLVSLAQHLDEARAYLPRVKSDRDETGTGAEGYGLSFAALIEIERTLLGASEAWAPNLRQEVHAALLVAQSLKALSDRRNLTAAAHLERVLKEAPQSLIVRALP